MTSTRSDRHPRLESAKLACALAAAAAFSPAFAQTPAAPAAAASAPTGDAAEARSLQTVTVSATRRAELIRDVPLAVTAVPAERLQESGAKSLNDYLAAVPGVVLQNSGLLDNSGFIVIRGLTTGIDSRSPTTVYLDETPLADGTPFDLNLLDLSRFEVLRGPQGTLYGSSAMGGIVKYTTRTPETDEFAARVNLGASKVAGGGNGHLLGAVLNAPIGQDVAGLRVAAFKSRDGGYVDATGAAGGRDVNRKEADGVRLDLLVTPSRRTSVRLNAMTQTRDSDGSNRVLYDLATGRPIGGELGYAGLDAAEPRTSQRDLASATVEVDFGWARFSSITSYQEVKDINRIDFSPFLSPLLGSSAAFADTDVRNRKTNQEFRLVSQTAGTLQWLVGAFLDRSDTRVGSTLVAVGGVVPGVLSFDGARREYDEMALYGNVTFNATSDLALTAGARVARYKQTDTVDQSGVLVGGPQPTRQASFDEKPTTYLLAAKYRLTAQSNVYARAASGYRAGGVNNNAVDPLTGQPIPGVRPSYGTDEVWSYEVGYKLGRPEASFEAALFQTDWKDLQQATVVNNVAFTSNLGKARIRGIELGAELRPRQGLSLGGSVSLLDPQLLSDSPGLQAEAGDRLPNSPKLAAALFARHALSAGGLPAFVGATVSHTGKRNSGFEGATASPNHRLPAYTTLDLSGGITIGKVELGLYVRNLTDKRGQLGAVTNQAPALGRTYVYVIDPRTIGLNLTASF